MWVFVRKLLIFLAGCFLMVSCGGPNRWATSLDWHELNFSDLPGPQDFPDEAAVILLDEGTMQIIGTDLPLYSEFERHRIIRILNKRGEKFANVVIPYFPRLAVDDIRARTISPSGKITVLSPSDIFDVNLYPGFIFYSDQRAKIFTMPAVEPGSIIEYRYKVTLSGKTLWHSWMFQEDVPTLRSRFTLINPSEWRLNYRLYNLELEPQIVRVPDGFKSTYIWDAHQIPGLGSEFAMPPSRRLVSHISFAPLGVESWDDVARWYKDLHTPQVKANEDIRRLAAEITAGITDRREKLQRIYQWVRDNIRYIAVSIGIGGYQPHPVREIVQNRYGDCKDMTTLLCALAEESGILVYPVLISTRQNGTPDTSLPSPFQFNHAIAYCPSLDGDGIWMDATEKGCPFGALPWYDQGMPVLVVDKKGMGEIKITPQSPPDSNRSVIFWKVDLREDGAAEISGETRFYGALATEMREELFYSSRQHLRQWLETYVAKRSLGAQLDTFWVEGLIPVVDPLVLNYRFQTATFLRERNHYFVLRPADIALFDLPDYFRSEQRRYPVFFRFGYRQEVILDIRLPDQLHLQFPQFEDSYLSPFGKVRRVWQQTVEGLTIHHSYQLDLPEIPPDQYREFRTFLNDTQMKDQQEIFLWKNEDGMVFEQRDLKNREIKSNGD